MKTKRKFLVIAAVLVLALAASGLVYLRSRNFQEFLHSFFIAQIEKNTGLSCRIEHLDADVYTGNLRLKGLELTAGDVRAGFSALRIREVRARVGLSSLWHFRVRLRELHLDHPQIEIFTGSNDEGSSWNPERFLDTLNVSLEMETEQFTVADGIFSINEYSAPFNLSLKDLNYSIGHQATPPAYRISLAYKQSRLFYKNRNIVHDLKLEAELSLDEIRIKNLEFRHGESLLSGSGSVSDWNSPTLRLDMSGSVTAKDLVLADASLNEGRGDVNVHTLVQYDSDGIYLNGEFSARSGMYRTMDYADIAGHLEILQDVLYLRDVTGHIDRGDFDLEGEIQLRSSNNKQNTLRIQARQVPLFEVGNLLNESSVNYWNPVDSETVLFWGKGRPTTIDCNALLFSADAGLGNEHNSTPLEGKARFSYLGDRKIDLSLTDLRSSHTSLSASGGKDALFHVRLITDRLSEPFDLISNFSPPVERLTARYPDLRTIGGNFQFDGDVRIRTSSDIAYKGNMSVENGQWRSVEVDHLNSSVLLEGSNLSFSNLSIQRREQTVAGNLSFDFAEDEKIGRFEFVGELGDIELSQFRDFGFFAPDMSGPLNGSGYIRMTGDSWTYNGLMTVERGNILGQPFDRLEAQVREQDGRIHFADVKIVRDGTDLTAEGYVEPESRKLDFRVRVTRFPLEKISGLPGNGSGLRGYANGSGFIHGTYEMPELEGSYELEELYFGSWDLGNGSGDLQLKEEVLSGSVAVQSEFGDLSARVRISVSDGYPGNLTLNFNKLNVSKIISGRTPKFLDINSTELNGRVDGEGNFGNWSSMKLSGEMDGALFRVNDYVLQNSEKIEFSVIENRLYFENAKIEGTGTDLSLGGYLPLDDTDLEMNLNGDINMKIISGLKEGLVTSGDAYVDVQATGSIKDPDFVGRLSLENTGLEYSAIPFPVSGIEGNLHFSENVMRLENVAGKVASGTFELSGAYEHRNTVMQSINLDLAIEKVRLPYPENFDSTIDANLNLRGDSELQLLSGDVDITRSEYIRDFNLLAGFTEQSGATNDLLTSEPALQNLRFNIEFRSNNGLIIDNELARVRGSLRLTLRGTPAYPSLTGRVEAGEGTIFFRGNRFEISHAYADFIDRNRINPVLEVRAEADVKTYRLILDATGTLDNLSVNITSDPPMSTVDIISLLTTGMDETGGQTSFRESQLAGMSAASVLSENLTGVIGRRVQRILGLESFRVDPFLAGAENDPTARITISERISRDIILTYSRNLSTNEEQVVVVEYDIGKGLSVIATRDEDGKFGVDFRLRRRFR